jgi:pilus assembly protein CpaB
MKQRMMLIISVVVGLIAFWITWQYWNAKMGELERTRQRMFAGMREVDVVAAGRDLPAGTVLSKKDLKAKPTFERDVSKDAVFPDDVDPWIVGKKLKHSKGMGDALSWSDVDVPFRPGTGLAPMVEMGMRAVSVSIGGAAAVSGLVQPNDRVDVLGSFYFPSKAKAGDMEAVTLTILQDVTVLATGQQLAKQGEGLERRGAAGYNTVTFAVTPREAEMLVFVENMRGHLTLTLRNPADVSYETNLPVVDFNLLEEEIPRLNVYRQQIIRHKGKP